MHSSDLTGRMPNLYLASQPLHSIHKLSDTILTAFHVCIMITPRLCIGRTHYCLKTEGSRCRKRDSTHGHSQEQAVISLWHKFYALEHQLIERILIPQLIIRHDVLQPFLHTRSTSPSLLTRDSATWLLGVQCTLLDEQLITAGASPSYPVKQTHCLGRYLCEVGS